MIKRMIILVFLTCILSATAAVKSQETAVREDIDNINSLLKANPYRDTFLEITFYYSIDITSDKELVVKMEFNGPFKTSVKARIIDLDITIQADSALTGTSSICWFCKPDETTRATSCVYNESITSDGEKESHYSDNICVMISRHGTIRNELVKAFDKLFKSVLEK